jgi:hypothetical protein
VTDTLGTWDAIATPDQSAALRSAIVNGDPKESLAALHRLTQPSYNEDGSVLMTPQEKLEYLVSLPPREIARTMQQAKDYLSIEHGVARQYAARFAQQGRRHTKAPPPIRPPKGGANPPVSLERLASKSENIDGYVKARQQQMKQERE